MRIPDYYDIWQAREFERDRWLERRPRCFHCGEPVQQEMAVNLRDYGWLCEECIKNNTEEVIVDD